MKCLQDVNCDVEVSSCVIVCLNGECCLLWRVAAGVDNC